jgi:hypothetical protein
VTAITGHVVKTERLEPTDSRAKFVVPAGFEVGVRSTAYVTRCLVEKQHRSGQEATETLHQMCYR